jgi:transcription-repair coupling factor (superfamily II helicase)
VPRGHLDARQSLLEFLPGDTLLIEESAGSNAEEVAHAWREAEAPPRRRPPARQEVPTAGGSLRVAGRCGVTSRPVRRPRRGNRRSQRRVLSPEPVDRDIRRHRAMLAADVPTVVLCDNEPRERLEELLTEARRASSPRCWSRTRGGFVMRSLRVLTDHEIFRRARRLRRARRYRQAAPSTATGQLQAGDYVVHLEHGIGIYRGIDTIQVGESTLEVAIVEYEGGDRLNVPLYRIDQLERYRAAQDDGDQPPPRLHKLGGSTWQRVRDRTRQAIREMAAELLDLYARRRVSAGYAFPPDTRWQRELESAFLYEDTPDQRKATETVKRMMEQPLPMDLLMAGDVGYGKTEIAVRAAFKAVQAGKQVVLARPFWWTARARSPNGSRTAMRLATLPRLHPPKEQAAALAAVAAGAADVAIGTWRSRRTWCSRTSAW